MFPPGHTRFSWLAGEDSLLPPGHTNFSWFGDINATPPKAAAPPELVDRLKALEAAAQPGQVQQFSAAVPSEWNECDVSSASAPGTRVLGSLSALGTVGGVLVRTPADYYDWTLEKRATLLRCRVGHLCKCVFLENKAADVAALETVKGDWRASKWICVTLQYTTRLDLPKLESAIRQCGSPQLSKKAVRFQVAQESDCATLTGFIRNAVTPFAGPKGCPVPVVVSASMTRAAPAYVWLGGGEVSLKLRVPVQQLVTSLQAKVIECTVPRDSNDSDSDD